MRETLESIEEQPPRIEVRTEYVRDEDANGNLFATMVIPPVEYFLIKIDPFSLNVYHLLNWLYGTAYSMSDYFPRFLTFRT